MNGMFYALSTGAGNPELLTLQAVRILKNCEIIFYPESERNTIALDTIKSLENEIDFSGKKLIPCTFSMTRDSEKSAAEYKSIASECKKFLSEGKNVAMLSIGDVSFWSTAARTSAIIQDSGFEVSFISGINSFSAAACEASLSLSDRDEKLTVIPGDAYFIEGKLKAELSSAGTKVLMKMGRHLREITKILEELNLIQKSTLVQKASLEGEKIFRGKEILEMAEEDLKNAYLSVLIVGASL